MTLNSKVKLVVPFFYAIASLSMVFITWPALPDINHYFGTLLIIVSFALWIIARIQLGDSFSIGAKANRLVTEGVYGKLRHPIYYFSILAVIGIGIYLWSPIISLVVILLVLLELFRIRQEEAVLAKKFGDKYEEYKLKTWF